MPRAAYLLTGYAASRWRAQRHGPRMVISFAFVHRGPRFEQLSQGTLSSVFCLMDANLPRRSDPDDVERFRPRLFGIAYRMLSDVQEAEDLVQETFLRSHQAKHDDLVTEEGWLVAVITRLAIDRLRRAETETAV